MMHAFLFQFQSHKIIVVAETQQIAREKMDAYLASHPAVNDGNRLRCFILGRLGDGIYSLTSAHP